MLDDRIKAMIRDFNPWWEEKESTLPTYERYMFKNLEKYMQTKQIIAIVGLRRVGKTTIMNQMIRNLLKEPANKQNIFYFLFDDLISKSPDILQEIIDYYIKTAAKEGKKYIFLDEIQKVSYWQDIIKRFYDTYEDIKFVVSGSASLEIKKSKESLAGRIFDFHIPALTFKEFIELNDENLEQLSLDYVALKEFYDKKINKKEIFAKMLIEYVYKGAFPEITKWEDKELIRNYIKSSVIDRIIYEDIPSVFQIERKDVLYAILEYCSKETSQLLDLTNLGKILGANYQTAKTYLFYLESSFLVDLIYNYSTSLAKQFRKSKKAHIVHPCITMALLRYPKESLEVEEIISKYIETIVFEHSKLFSDRIFFWRSAQKDEIDIVTERKELMPIEVKYRRNIDNTDISSLLKFMELYSLKEGILVTRDLLDQREIKDKKITFIPAWIFLLTAKWEE